MRRIHNLANNYGRLWWGESHRRLWIRGEEVLHATQKSYNASVACNTHFRAGYRPGHVLSGLKFPLSHHNMESVNSFGFPAQILIIPEHV
jgi:hypothetical protein